jgi:hypothetical protein
MIHGPYFNEKYMQYYPSWRYHRTEPAVIVNSPEEDDALGSGWADTPAAFANEPGAAETECSSKKKTTTKKKK